MLLFTTLATLGCEGSSHTLQLKVIGFC